MREKSKQYAKGRNMVLTGQQQINDFTQLRQTDISSKILGYNLEVFCPIFV